VETVGTAVTPMESMMAYTAYLNSLEQNFTAAIENSIDFKGIRSTGCSLYHQKLISGIVRGVMQIYMQTTARQRLQKER
jgi:hypothetical protein